MKVKFSVYSDFGHEVFGELHEVQTYEEFKKLMDLFNYYSDNEMEASYANGVEELCYGKAELLQGDKETFNKWYKEAMED